MDRSLCWFAGWALLLCMLAAVGCGDDTEVAADTTADVAADGGPDALDDAESDPAGDTPDAASPDSGPQYAESFRVVRVQAGVTAAEQLSVHACAGLYNRRLGGAVMVLTDEDVPQANLDGALVQDGRWLEALDLSPSATLDAATFLAECVAEFGGCVRYSYADQHEILPSILTVAAAEGVPMLADESVMRCEDPVVDATAVFAERTTQLAATQYVYENYLDRTTGLAMLNPGYDRFAPDLAAPDLIEDMPLALIDFVFSRRLFVVFLINGCVVGNAERTLLSQIVNQSEWPKPVGVWGYNDSWLTGGYLYEAQTRCLESANMGAIPTRTTNLSFFSTRRPPIVDADELARNPSQVIPYDPDKTYVAFVIGDGDNVRYIMSTRRDWLQQRLDRCQRAQPTCPPLNWTISPHLPVIAPDVLRWYYEAAATTGGDYFMLPPSGYQYAYPGRMPPAEQERFAAETEAAGRLLGARSVVHWEWFADWDNAVRTFLPRYARQGGQIQGIFPVNVPYLFEAFPRWPAGQTYEILEGDDGGRAVLFRSQSWRGVDGRDDFHPTPQMMSDRLAALPPGTVTWVYMTSDGGLTLENSFVALSGLLPDTVQIVSADAAAQLALQASVP